MHAHRSIKNEMQTRYFERIFLCSRVARRHGNIIAYNVYIYEGIQNLDCFFFCRIIQKKISKIFFSHSLAGFVFIRRFKEIIDAWWANSCVCLNESQADTLRFLLICNFLDNFIHCWKLQFFFNWTNLSSYWWTFHVFVHKSFCVIFFSYASHRFFFQI